MAAISASQVKIGRASCRCMANRPDAHSLVSIATGRMIPIVASGPYLLPREVSSMRKSFLAMMILVLWAVSARPKIAEAAAAPRFYVQTQDLMGGGHGLLITLLSAEPVTMSRLVLNNRPQVAGCDSHQARHLRQGDQFRVVIPPPCGNFVRIDLYTDRGAVNYTVDRPD